MEAMIPVPGSGHRGPATSTDAPTTADEPAHRGQVVQGSSWVMLGFVAHAVTGIAFWFLAARLFATDDVGRAAAVIASLQFVNYATAMGLQEMLARFHAEARTNPDGLFTWSIAIATGVSSLGSIVYLTAVPSARDGLAALGTPAAVALFASLSAGAAVALLVDVRFMAQRQWKWVFWRLALTGAARVPALWLPAPGGHDALWLFVVAVTPIAISGAIGVVWLRATERLHVHLTPRPGLSGPAFRYASVNYLAHLGLAAPQFVLPVIVLVNVEPAANANFFLAWSIASVAFVLPIAIARVLVVEASRPRADVAASVRRALVLAVSVMVVMTFGAITVGPFIATIYGSSYSEAGRLLPTLVGAGIAWAVTSIVIGNSRVRHDPVGTVLVTLGLAGCTIALAVFLVPSGGIAAAAKAWLYGNVGAAILALIVWRRAASSPVTVTPDQPPVGAPA